MISWVQYTATIWLRWFLGRYSSIYKCIYLIDISDVKIYLSNYKRTYKRKRPNLLKLKKIYDKAVDPFKQYNDLNLDKNDIDLIKFDLNTTAVKELINF